MRSQLVRRGRRIHSVLMGSIAVGLIAVAVPAASATYTPVVQSAKLTASDGVTNGHLGMSVAVSGDLVVAGAPGIHALQDAAEGAVYVFTKPAGGWADAVETAKLTASDGATTDSFGRSVAVEGDTIVVGAPGNGSNQGAVYVFVKPAGGWADTTETAKLTVSDGTSDDFLGTGVAIHGDTVAAGAPATGSALKPGAVYLFEKPETGWSTGTQAAKLTASDAVTADGLGASVAMSPDVIAAGATGDDIDGRFGQGSVYVYEKPTGGWATGTETAKLTASDGAAFDELGRSVAVSGDVVVAGAPCRDRVDTASFGCQAQFETDEGALYLFSRPASGWGSATQTGRLSSSATDTKVMLGLSVAVDGDVVVGGPTGVFARPTGGWSDVTETQTLVTGRAVATRQGLIAAGVGDGQNVGSVTLFEAPPDQTAPTTSLKIAPSTPDGANGWYVTAPSLTVRAVDGTGGSGVADTRCVLDPIVAPLSFDDIPSGCKFAAGGSITRDGTHSLYAASVDVAGNKESPVTLGVNVDRTAPLVTCGTAPTFALRGAGASVTAAVDDATSGPASSVASATADVSVAGGHTATVTGFDVAGNSAEGYCDYLVSYVVAIENPTDGRRVKAGSPIQVRFSLRDALGERIPDGEAEELATSCSATVRFDDGSRQCALYNPRRGSFDLTLRTAKSTAIGSHTVWVEIRVGSDYVNAEHVEVIVR